MTTRGARVVRGLIAAAFSVFVAAFSHAFAGGASPSTLAIGVSFAVSALVCIVLTGKRLSLPKLSVSVGLSQFLFHAVFSLWTTAPTMPTGMQMNMGGMAPAVGTLQAPDAMPQNGWMWLAHAAAAIVTIAALRWGERAFWALLLLARLCIATLLPSMSAIAVHRSPRPRVTPHASTFVPRNLVLLLSPIRHRGPPVLSV